MTALPSYLPHLYAWLDHEFEEADRWLEAEALMVGCIEEEPWVLELATAKTWQEILDMGRKKYRERLEMEIQKNLKVGA